MTTTDVYGPFIEMLRGGTGFLIGTHVNPDGDGIGSMLALGQALCGLGKEVTLLSADPVPESLAFLPGSHAIVTHIPPAARFDAAILVDCAEPARAGAVFERAAASLPLGILDHHLLRSCPDAVVCLDEGAASTGEVVWRLIDALGVKQNAAMATCIYTTLVVDTGFFRYSNTTADVLGLASELVRVGADPWTTARNMDESYPERRMRLLALSLATLDLRLGGRYASMTVTQDMLAATGANLIDSDEFAIYPRSIKSVEVAGLFRERADGTVKVSVRSKDIVNVAAIALRHDGGGHKHAAGFTYNGSLADAKRVLEDEVDQALRA